MRTDTPHIVTPTPAKKQRMLTFASGGWVILLASLMTVALTVWAVLPAIAGFSQRPPGRKGDVPSFLFNTDHARVPIGDIYSAHAHRDLLKALTNPEHMPGSDMARFNSQQRGKYVVPMDPVIGVVVNGEPRAYPLHLLEVHEIVNDTIAGVPVAVTYNPPSGAAIVFDRRVGDATLEFGVSGLVLDSNLLMYRRHDDPAAEPGGESLWSQMLGMAVTGEDAKQQLQLTPISCAIAPWHIWLHDHPQTTVVMRDEAANKRYKQFNYDLYLKSDEIVDGVDPLPPADSDLRLKAPVIIIGEDDNARVHSVERLQARADSEGIIRLTLDDQRTLELHCTADPLTCFVAAARDADGNIVEPPLVRYALWFAWYAAHGR